MTTKKTQSEHIFIFPFSWRYPKEVEDAIFRQHTQLMSHSFKVLENWLPIYTSISTAQDYNEFVYFYEPIRAALYTFNNRPIIVRSYKYKHLNKEAKLIMGVEGKIYEVRLKNIELKLYKTGIGLLFFNVMNTSYTELSEIEAINTFSKCIYPPQLPLEEARAIGFPEFIKLNFKDELILYENFQEDYLKDSLTISSMIMEILGKDFRNQNDPIIKHKIQVKSIMGNQMFCCCIYENIELATSLLNGKTKFETLDPIMNFSQRVREIQREQKGEGATTYLKNQQHVYGMSRYMLFCISKDLTKSKLYNQIVTLILVQRGTLLSLSTEIARVSTLAKYELPHAIASLYEIYIQFINQLYFREVTEEVEGSRIYEGLAKALKIEEELQQLNSEIGEVHEYATLVEQSASSLKVQLLTIIGAALVLPSFVTGFFGMNIFKDEAPHWWTSRNIGLWLNSYVALPILVVIALCLWNRKRTPKAILIKSLYLFLFLMSITLIIKNGCGL